MKVLNKIRLVVLLGVFSLVFISCEKEESEILLDSNDVSFTDIEFEITDLDEIGDLKSSDVFTKWWPKMKYCNKDSQGRLRAFDKTSKRKVQLNWKIDGRRVGWFFDVNQKNLIGKKILGYCRNSKTINESNWNKKFIISAAYSD